MGRLITIDEEALAQVIAQELATHFAGLETVGLLARQEGPQIANRVVGRLLLGPLRTAPACARTGRMTPDSDEPGAP